MNKIRTDLTIGGAVPGNRLVEQPRTNAALVRPVRLLYNDQLSEGVYLLAFKRDVAFTAGQVIGIGMTADGPRRLYSICSGEDDPELKVLYNLVEDGFLTPKLSDFQEGSTIWVTMPRGSFRTVSGPAVWIATGTGIAPYYSMLHSGLADDKILIHGERYLERFHFYDEFQEAFGERYVRCCTTEADESSFMGRVTDFLQETEELDPGLKYYLCGRAEMVVEARDILINKGVPFDHIVSEIYF